MLPFLISLLLTAHTSPAVLTIPQEMLMVPIDKKEIWIDALAQCESGGNTSIAIIDTNGYWSRGLFQFQLSTWLKYGKKFNTRKENIFDGDLQRKVVKEMLDDGGYEHWHNCSEIISKSLGPYPL